MNEAPAEWFFCLFIATLAIVENLCLPVDLSSSSSPFFAWLSHGKLWLGRQWQHTRSPLGNLTETSVEDSAVNTQFEIAGEPDKLA